MRNFYLLGVLLCMLIGSGVHADPLHPDAPVNAKSNLALSAPGFTPDNVNYYRVQTDISFRAHNLNGRGVTEVYRAKTEEDNWVLATTFTESETMVHDYNLSPRTDYKYRMRVVDGNETSPWSGLLLVRTLSKYYEPTVVTTWPYYNEVLLTITDNTYYDAEYEISRIDENGSTNLGTFTYPDSGQVFTLFDVTQTPGATVTYEIWMKPLSEEDPNAYLYHHVVQTTLPALELINPGDWGQDVCGSQNLILMAYSDNSQRTFGSELYRSENPDGPWTLAANVPAPSWEYVDDVAPRVGYYYKARLVEKDVYSPYSNVIFYEGTSDWYNPGFEVSLNGSDVQVKLTDNTHADDPYRLYRDDLPSYIATIVAPDSGGVYIYNDTTVLPGTTYEYYLEATAHPFCATWPSEDVVASATITTPNGSLPVPNIANAEEWEYICGSMNKIAFSFPDSLLGGASIDLYRSTSENGIFSLIATIEPYAHEYLDDVAPRVGYFYKARLVYDGEYSPYSNTLYIEGDSDWYIPGFEVSLNGSDVQVKITDNSYKDYAYRLLRDDFPASLETIILPDSGSVYIYKDSLVAPGTTYTYYLEATTDGNCDAWPYEDIVATAQITTPVPADYTITSFTLVDPVNDVDVGPLVNGQKITITAPYFYNIRANTDAKTKSVMFFLNNKRRSDNGGPIFTYFGEKNGDYAAGLSKQGVYVLEATPYSEKNGKGIKGETIIIEFEVLGPDADYTIKGFTLVDPITDTDIGPLEDGAVVEVSLAANIRANADPKTKAIMFFLNNKRRADNGAPIFTYFGEKGGDYAKGLVATGHYVLKATPSSEKNLGGVVGETVIIEFDVVCSSCDVDQARIAKVGEVSFFPNPVVSTSHLKIQTLPESDVRIQIVDQLGLAITAPIKLTADENGELVHPVSALNLDKGIYLLTVEVNGQQIMKRFVVE